MRVLCPAKINLHLRVGSRRAADGFHPLLTWMTTVSLFDTLTVEQRSPQPPEGARRETARDHTASPSGRECAGDATGILSLSSNLPGLAADETNLVVRAARVFAAAIAGSGAGDVESSASAGRSRATGHGSGAAVDSPFLQHPPADDRARRHAARQPGGPRESGVGEGDDARGITGQTSARVGGEVARVDAVGAVLEKAIPLGAGLGGGSSDAARTLLALNRLWRIDWPPARLAAVAEQLGSDVPFFLHGPSSVCTGRGEAVQPVPPPRVARWAVLVLPAVHMPTAAVYGRFDAMHLGFDDALHNEPAWEQWAGLPAKDLLGRLVNDLETPAFDIAPDLARLRGAIESYLVRPVRMSGSGSSLFTLYDDRDDADAHAREVAERFAVRAMSVELAPVVVDDLNADDLNTTGPFA